MGGARKRKISCPLAQTTFIYHPFPVKVLQPNCSPILLKCRKNGYQCLDMEGGNEGTKERGKGETEGEKQ